MSTKDNLVKAGLLIGGLAIGYGVGFYLTKKRVTDKYELFIKTELQEIKEEYAALKLRDTYVSPAEAVAALHGADAVVIDPDAEQIKQLVVDNNYTLPGDQGDQDQNIFVDGAPYVVPPEEDESGFVMFPTPEKPYIISEMLYHEHDPNYTKESLTYYEADDTLCDPQDRQIDDVNGLIGADFADHFGEGSNDPEIVYIRNENRSIDLEVTLNQSSYKVEVLGVVGSPKDKPRPIPRMREGDDQ